MLKSRDEDNKVR